MKKISHKNRPQLVYRFVRTIEPTVKPGTWKMMVSSLSQFHSWLTKKNFSLNKMDRDVIISWLSWLKKKQYQPVTIRYKISTLKRYLCWLAEHDIISINPNVLILNIDYPKIPTYLPKPLSKDVDFELQKRLRNSDNHLHHHLLLMRKIGVRISELINLEYNCLHHDHKEHYFIKIPIGKLYNERLVPLDKKTVELVREIQGSPTFKKTWLVEYKTGIKPKYNQYTRALDQISDGLDLSRKITTHRLRHTYATSLLNGGLSLLAVMKLLGHRSPKMTLRYAELTQETLCEEYFSALSRYEGIYKTEHNNISTTSQAFDPVAALNEVILWVKKKQNDSSTHCHDTQLLYRRLKRAKKSLENLINNFEKSKE